MKKIFLLLALFLFIATSFAQELDKKTQKQFNADFIYADELFNENNYKEALGIYLKLLKLTPDNANLMHRIGICYINSSHDKEKAIDYLEKAVRNSDIKANPASPLEQKSSVEAFFDLGRALHINYKCTDAIKVLDGYIDKVTELDNKDSLIEKAELQKEICENAIELMKKPIPMKVEILGEKINTSNPEYSPFVNADESFMIFTTKREENTGGKQTEDGNYFEDIYFTIKDDKGAWSEAKPISQNINTDRHDACCGMSYDGEEIFIYRDDGNIYSSKQLGMGAWSEPQTLGEFVNSKFNEKGASMSRDGNFLFFSSDRPGGYGKFDIYISKKLPNGQWGEAFNLGPNVNTEGDDIGPFFHPDGSTLFFASEGHNTMGGFDVFYSIINIESSTSGVPVNLGYPINSTSDDVFLCITPDGKRAYYSSDQPDGHGFTDICMILFQDPINKSLTVLSGLATKADTKEASGISITLTEDETQETAGTFTPNSNSGKYIFILQAGKKYTAFYECDGYIPQTKTVSVNKDSTYEKLNNALKIEKVELIKPSHSEILTFEKNETVLTDEMIISLDKCIAFLNSNKAAKTKIHMTNESDQHIANSRQEKVIEYLTKKGIAKERIFKNNEKCDTKQICKIHLNKNLQKIISKKEILTDIDKEKILPNITAIDTIAKLAVGMTFTLDNILFPVNKSYLTDASYIIVNKLLDILNKYPNLHIEISGHTDNTGPNKRNKKLSKDRAKGVADYLIMKGIDKNRLQFAGYGSERPMVSNGTPEGKKLNRRVEIKILKD